MNSSLLEFLHDERRACLTNVVIARQRPTCYSCVTGDSAVPFPPFSLWPRLRKLSTTCGNSLTPSENSGAAPAAL